MESIMSSLPRERAGVGSAVANTVRQVSAALGIAVLGAIVAASYRDQIADTARALPEPARGLASESVAGAYGVAERLGAAGQPLISAANDAFVSAMHLAALGSGVAAVIAALVVLRWMPGRGEANLHPLEAPARADAQVGQPSGESALAEVS
jgi:hypothetical protein